jgi:hypothetical protein
MRKPSAERIRTTNMTNTEATSTEKGAAVAEQGATVAPEKASSKKGATRKKSAPKGQKMAKSSKAKAAPPKKAAKAGKKAGKFPRANQARVPGAESKGSKILEMIGRPKGATLSEIMNATTWQAHSVRGFISTAGKKHSIKIESSKSEAGERVYKIAK